MPAIKATHQPSNINSSTPPVVGIGASAGGLDALEAFFSNLPANTGFAFIVVTHQQPDHVSLLPELLHHYTNMPVLNAEDGAILKPDHVFVCPPGKNLAVLKHRLHLSEPGKYNAANLPIDFFLRSLAEDAQAMSVGIILSGTGTDGTLGLKAIKGVSGLTLVLTPQTAKFDGMPSSAILMGDVDFVLPPEQMGHELIKYSKGPYFKKIPSFEPALLVAPQPIQKIFTLLRNRTGNDFSTYKPTTIKRRIARRMNIHQLSNADEYVHFLQENPVEIDKLAKELLINVTNFFRDADAFSALSETALPKLFAGKPDNYEFRIWVTGCSSGEEAYSIAILFKEAIEKKGNGFSFQIFATDLDESSINRARDGLYPAGIAADVSAIRLQRFFKLDDNQYRINKEIRERVIFATQNLIQDPPFTHIDLISCRNLLIYINQELQKEILPQFHYALKPDGILFLGSSESIGNFEDRFLTLDKKWKIYQRKNIRVPFPVSKLSSLPLIEQESSTEPFKALSSEFQTGNIAKQIERLLLERYVPVSVIINEHGKIIYIHGKTGNYLEPTTGQPNWNIVEMAREGLRMPLVASLSKATKTSESEIISSGLKVKTNGDFATIDLTVTKIAEPESLRDLFLVSFQPQKLKDVIQPPIKTLTSSTEVDNTLEKEQLEQELYFTKESLRATIEELQTSNEEIKSSNEELQSTNEELQSSNEELETSKEEMQSLNEELNTVNSELQNKVERLSEINDDMQNLMNSTDIATIFLDNQLQIKRFTRPAKNIFKLIDSDIGRPLGDLVSILKYDHLIDDARAVLQTLAHKEAEVQSQHDRWYLLRILPYRTTENMIDGLVITFIDITRTKKAEKIAQAAELTTAIVNTINQPLLVLDDQLQVLTTNPAYEQMFNNNHIQLTGQSFFDIHNQAFNSPLLRKQVTNTLTNNTAFEKFCVETEFADIGKKRITINGRILNQIPGVPILILLAIEDAT
ncbi:MAG: CheR family methyltransferase [Methylococcaceae bacterium]|nr:CheR family methyltransferase [Methylococcaceae bacterium]MDZ4155101.1 CheR family methyltransferase [Methylococcales bacterium]MDP2394454.1 CheR family methyltransferase [Methylococcaceae bacterium]MDP3021497.1 CheR family methyltransferase [Methylococcaceae bacterium]MDP3390384.1 CheR family methyltransferase [Methylococcaceae bacterium]